MISSRLLSAPPATTLLVSPVESDHATLRGIFSRSHWDLRSACGCREALAILDREVIPVVICVDALPDGTWMQLMKADCYSSVPPRVIVSSRLPHDSLWTEVLRAGAYDFLPMPWSNREVLKLNSLAWQSWTCACRSAYARRDNPSLRASAPEPEEQVLAATSAS